MCVNVSWTSWAALAWGRIFPRGSPTYFCHPLHNPPYADALCFSLSVTIFFSLSHSLTPPTVLDSIKQDMVIKRNVSAFIKNSTEYRAYSVKLSLLELFDCQITGQSPVLYLRVCAHILCECVFNLLLLSSHFMGLLSIDCAALREREIASHSRSVTLSVVHSLFSASLFSPFLSSHNFSFT